LAICDLLQCPSIGEFARDGFISGWRNASSGSKQYDSTTVQAQYVDSVRKKLSADPDYFKQVYRNSFKLAKPEGQKSVPMDSAIDFWNMFFRSGKGGMEWNTPSTKWLDLWCEFYESKNKRPVNKDLWNMVGELVMKTKEPGGESLSWWTEDGAWPMAVDDFVAYVKDKRKADGDTMDTS
jgi:DCN1-like protein 1/2